MRKWLPASRELPEGSVQTAVCDGASSSQQTSSTRTTMGLSATDPSFGLVECVCSCSASSAEVYRSFSDAQWIYQSFGTSRYITSRYSGGRRDFHLSASTTDFGALFTAWQRLPVKARNPLSRTICLLCYEARGKPSVLGREGPRKALFWLRRIPRGRG